jgi:hypothetical protein
MTIVVKEAINSKLIYVLSKGLPSGICHTLGFNIRRMI